MAKQTEWIKRIIVMLAAAALWVFSIPAAAESQAQKAYSRMLEEWQASGQQEVKDVFREAVLSDYSGAEKTGSEESRGYGKETVLLEKGDSVSYTVLAEKSGLYAISVDYFC
ncbi:MAG: hypothetical protein NC489_43110, partial [Ruminococcus flavefaciens]|nr:hypothetical protein [Ruminococcus flavefaciens]